ncbi:recombinase family protein [Paenibacillus gorillae]|uniref:recombinase family protein n=1 Tax=Paenibacillus gorillae TaxID=1243662 RepID=UPI0004BAE2D4|nr:recombinase family protein [Paenibacillus gorillae]
MNEISTGILRIVLYIRVSTEEQAKEGYSLISQETVLRREAKRLGAVVTAVYTDDGYSAKNMKRPALKKMLIDSHKGTFDAILFTRLDRFTRRSKDFHNIIDMLGKNDVGIISLAEKIDTTSAIGRFQLELSVSLAQLERETNSERVSQVMEERALKGLRNGGPSALGYKVIDGKYTIDPIGVKAHDKVFDLYREGNGYKGIAHIMLADPEMSHLLKWSSAGVKYILQNPICLGINRYKYVDKNNHLTGNPILTNSDIPAIKDQETFDWVQFEIKRRKKGGKSFTSEHVFSAVLRCGWCGANMQGFSYKHKTKVYKTYRCGDKIEKGTCAFPNTRENGVTEAFLEHIDLSKFDMTQVPLTEQDNEGRIKEIKNQLARLEQRKKNWRLAFANDLLSLDELREHLSEDKEKEDKLLTELHSLESNSSSKWLRSEVMEELKLLKQSWAGIDDKAKKLFIQNAYKHMVVDIAPGQKAGQGLRPKLVIRDYQFITQ